IVPTYNHVENCLKPCLKSILNQGLKDAEVIVVANGCRDGTEDHVKSLGSPVKLISSPDPLGYTRAVNVGISAAAGDMIVLINDDCQILDWGRDSWLDLLESPMSDPKIAATGSSKDVWAVGRPFLVFDLVMIRKKTCSSSGFWTTSSTQVVARTRTSASRRRTMGCPFSRSPGTLTTGGPSSRSGTSATRPAPGYPTGRTTPGGTWRSSSLVTPGPRPTATTRRRSLKVSRTSTSGTRSDGGRRRSRSSCPCEHELPSKQSRRLVRFVFLNYGGIDRSRTGFFLRDREASPLL
ncbi:MAG: glycosyltransferase, partial [Gemmatimonadales bacterium]